ncbi:OmpA family protein [Algibacillus agarilyticus]|uniref:OmpA family protein n=1 Tax=Algibacillus agarilyticus TaxID=2234133 RepID=UPI000DCFCD46|nr:OmpA family protein [Algibacillus agarilyticus]
MTSAKDKPDPTDPNHDLNSIRDIVLGKDSSHVVDAVNRQAREIVRDVVTEALHDREQSDQSVNKILVPLVEKSVEQSVANRSEQMVSALYPLVGSLVRKSVSAFFAEFMQKTNQLIENSFTWRGIKWRYQAWRQGINYAEYITRKTFSFRVEQVLLIHAKTGLLLKSISVEKDAADADLVSAMLTAINDFVSDSFQQEDSAEQQSLSVVKTNDFTLVVKPGPNAILVGAVTGTVPETLNQRFDLALEEVHQIYHKQLLTYEGDNEPFEACDPILRQCLISQLNTTKKTVPWLAFIVMGIASVALIGGLTFRFIQLNKLSLLKNIGNEQGIVLLQANLNGISQFNLKLLRDTHATPITEWLKMHELNIDHVNVQEFPFVSTEPEIINHKIQSVIDRYNAVQFESMSAEFNGQVNLSQYKSMQSQLLAIPGFSLSNYSFDKLLIDTPKPAVNLLETREFNMLVNDINQSWIEFDIEQGQLSTMSKKTLSHVHKKLVRLIDLSIILNIDMRLLIIGISDKSGQSGVNKKLSEQRAFSVKQYLVKNAIKAHYIHALGAGEIDDSDIASNARRAVFSVLLLSDNNKSGFKQ